MHSLGQRIREFRLKKGLTQIELAKGIITPSMVSQIESDRARPSYKVLVAIADRLEVPLEYLLKEVNFDLEHSSKHKMAMSMVQAKEYETAIPLFEDLLEIATHRISKESLLLELALCHLEIGDAVEAENYLNQLHRIANNDQDDRLLAAVLLQLGRVAALKSDFPIALFHTNRAWEELQKVEEIDADFHMKVLMQLATFYEKVGKVGEAAVYYEKALRLNQFNGVDRGRMYLHLAEIYDRQKKFEQAEEYAVKAAVLLEEQANKNRWYELQRRMIMLQRGSVDWKRSVQKLLPIVKHCEREGDHKNAGEVYADLALICFEHQEYEEAQAYAEEARLLLPDTDPALGNVHRVLSFVYFHRNDEGAGQEHLDSAEQIFETHGMVSELEEVTLHMCRYLSGKGQHRAAYERLERFHRYMIKQLEKRGILV